MVDMNGIEPEFVVGHLLVKIEHRIPLVTEEGFIAIIGGGQSPLFTVNRRSLVGNKLGMCRIKVIFAVAVGIVAGNDDEKRSGLCRFHNIIPLKKYFYTFILPYYETRVKEKPKN